MAARKSRSSSGPGWVSTTRIPVVSRRMRAHDVETARLRIHLAESGPQDGEPVVLVHGNLSTGRFYEHLFAGAPERYRLIAPDMRGFGDSEPLPIDATRGLA